MGAGHLSLSSERALHLGDGVKGDSEIPDNFFVKISSKNEKFDTESAKKVNFSFGKLKSPEKVKNFATA